MINSVDTLRQYKTITGVVEEGLCCFCGACKGVCTVNAIHFEIEGSFPVPIVDIEMCTGCGLCVEVCPGHSVDFDLLNKAVFEEVPEDKILGCHQSCIVGAVTDEVARIKRTSGGLAKEIAIWGLETGRWEGAVISGFSKDNPLRTETFIAKTPQQIESSSSSLYCPVTPCTTFQHLRNFSGKVCFIGLPCHIHAIRKAQLKLSWLREKIAFTMGLFCSGTPGYWATEAFLGYHGIDPKKVTSFEYRSEGWPGRITVQLEGQKKYSFARGSAAKFFDQLRFNAAFQRRGGFVCRRCLTCPDHVAELADISLGDAWHCDYPDKANGLNVAIIRTSSAQQIITNMKSAGRIFTDQIPSSKALYSQKACLLTKKKLTPTIKALQKRAIPVPHIVGQPHYSTGLIEKMAAWLEIKQVELAKDRRKWQLLRIYVLIMAILRRFSPKEFQE